MAITLDSLTLPADLVWSDEFAWAGSISATKRTIQGRAIVQAQSVPTNSGRSITLGSDSAWLTRADLLTLQGWAGVAGKEMLLTLHDGRSFQVVFRHWEAPAIDAGQVFATADPEATDTYNLNALRLAVV